MKASWCIVALGLTAAVACTDTPAPVGEIVLSVQTDVALPDSVDQIRIEISAFGSLIFGNDYEVGAGKLLIPATLGLVAGKHPADPILIRVIAKKNGAVKMLREVTTPVPADRVVSLRVPIRWLCDDSGQETSPGTFTNKTCAAGQTCIDGDCYGTGHDTTTDDNGQSDVCFDVVACLHGGATAQTDADCTIAGPADPTHFNVGLAVDGDGICLGGECFVILDKSRDGTTNPPEGWRILPSGRVQLPRAVCTRLASTPPRIKQVVTSSTCAPKTDRDPPCGTWSSVGNTPVGPTPPGTPPPVPPGAPGVIAGETGKQILGAQYACPMTILGDKLYWCSAGADYVAELVAMPTAGGAPSSVLPLGNTNNFTGAFRAPDRLYTITRVTSPADVETLYSTTGLPTPVNLGPLVPSSPSYILPTDHRYALDAQRIYFAKTVSPPVGYELFAAPLGSGAVTRVGTSLGNKSIGPIVADGDPVNGFVYFTIVGDQLGGKAQIARVTKAGADNTPEVIAFLSTQQTAGLMLSGTDLYYVGTDLAFAGASSVYRLPVAGGAEEQIYPGYFAGHELEVDGDSIYWMAKSAADSDVGIFKAPKAGGAAPVLLAHEPNIVSFAVGSDGIYYGAVSLPGAPTLEYHVTRVLK